MTEEVNKELSYISVDTGTAIPAKLGVRFSNDIFALSSRGNVDINSINVSENDINRLNNTFEVFGLDFMIDSNFNVFLIEINTNPDITACC